MHANKSGSELLAAEEKEPFAPMKHNPACEQTVYNLSQRLSAVQVVKAFDILCPSCSQLIRELIHKDTELEKRIQALEEAGFIRAGILREGTRQ